METKEMTQEEVFAYLNNTKIMCASEEESKKVQEKLFELGIDWCITGCSYGDSVYLFFIVEKHIEWTPYISFWISSDKRRIELNEILAIQIKEEPEPKFDPRTLQDFDKVLVREENTNKWRLSFFDTYEQGSFCCTDYCYKQCVPYNEETKHLKGTTEEAPEYYVTWE